MSDKSPTLDGSAGARIVARSFYKELRSNGFTPRQMLALSAQLIELITSDIRKEGLGGREAA